MPARTMFHIQGDRDSERRSRARLDRSPREGVGGQVGYGSLIHAGPISKRSHHQLPSRLIAPRTASGRARRGPGYLAGKRRVGCGVTPVKTNETAWSNVLEAIL